MLQETSRLLDRSFVCPKQWVKTNGWPDFSSSDDLRRLEPFSSESPLRALFDGAKELDSSQFGVELSYRTTLFRICHVASTNGHPDIMAALAFRAGLYSQMIAEEIPWPESVETATAEQQDYKYALHSWDTTINMLLDGERRISGTLWSYRSLANQMLIEWKLQLLERGDHAFNFSDIPGSVMTRSPIGLTVWRALRPLKDSIRELKSPTSKTNSLAIASVNAAHKRLMSAAAHQENPEIWVEQIEEILPHLVVVGKKLTHLDEGGDCKDLLLRVQDLYRRQIDLLLGRDLEGAAKLQPLVVQTEASIAAIEGFLA